MLPAYRSPLMLRTPLLFALALTGLPALPAAAELGRVDVCHIPKGSPEDRHVISVPPNAVDAHIKRHGDQEYLGTEICGDDQDNDCDGLIDEGCNLCHCIADVWENTPPRDADGNPVGAYDSATVAGIPVDTVLHVHRDSSSVELWFHGGLHYDVWYRAELVEGRLYCEDHETLWEFNPHGRIRYTPLYSTTHSNEGSEKPAQESALDLCQGYLEALREDLIENDPF